MKKIIIALMIMGVANISAEAQAKKNVTSGNQNFKVCVNNGAYYTCGKEGSQSTTSKATHVRKINKLDREAWTTPMATPAEPLSMNTINAYEGYYKKHNIVVSDDMNNPYLGKDSRQNDGPAMNDERNLNVNQTSIYLPPSSGEYTK